MEKKSAVFFDRDGVLNIDHGYVHRKEDFEWVPGAIETIKWLNDNNYWVFVVTNQGGVARGYYTEQNIHALHSHMSEDLKKIGAHIDAFYYCPHYKEGQVEQYSIECTCRKPQPGLLLRAVKEWSIDMNQTFMVGDKQSDMEAAATVGIPGYLFKGGNLYEFLKDKLPPKLSSSESEEK